MRTLDNLKEAATTLTNYVEELEREIEEMEVIADLFDDEYHARDVKDYAEELSDIFDDAYDAQAAKDISDAADYAGWSDVSDIEEASEELEAYRDLGTPEELRDLREGGNTKELEARIEALEAELVRKDTAIQKLIAVEDQRIRAIHELGAVSIEQAEIDIRSAEEGAYDAGLQDGLVLGNQREQENVIDIDLTPHVIDTLTDPGSADGE